MSTGGADKPGSGGGGGGGGAVKTPSDFLKSIRGRPVVVKLNSGVDYRGIALPLVLTALSSNPRKRW
jgi:U6 snRNA-associated Sm-like protein LSm6